MHTLLFLFCLLLPVPAHAAPSLEPVLADIAEDRLFKRADVALQVVELRSGEEVFARGAGKPMSPASTTKVITAATALKELGPAYRFKTQLLAESRPDANGVLGGNLYVRGGGDPTLVIEKLWKMVVDLKLAGVQKVEGDLVFDDSFFDSDHRLPGWTKAEDIERGPAYFPSISALSLNFNTVSLIVRPGAKVGGKGAVALETPADGYIEVVNQVKTGAAGGRRAIRITREVVGETMRFTVGGSIPAQGSMARYYRTVEDPTAHFMAVFSGLAASQGVEVGGTALRGATPEDLEALVSLESRPLVVVLMDMNKFSNNFMAEQVLRTVGAEVEGASGSTEKGLLVVSRYLASLGLTQGQDFSLVNGSGLSYDARLSAEALTTVLLDMYRDPQVGPEFAASLALSGLDGTLSKRLDDNPGMVRGKTGTVNGVHCLAGYLQGGDGREYAFAFLVNEVPGGIAQVKTLHDRFARKLLELEKGQAASEPPKTP